MHVAASVPQWVAPGDIPAGVLAEKRVRAFMRYRVGDTMTA